MERSNASATDVPSRGSIALDVSEALRHGQRIESSRERWADPDVRDRWTLRIGALAFAIPAALLAVAADWSTVRIGVLLLCVGGLALASTVELEVGTAAAVPTEPIAANHGKAISFDGESVTPDG